jgi:hypothetical protein
MALTPIAERPVTQADHVVLSRLVTEHTWRADNGRTDAVAPGLRR